MTVIRTCQNHDKGITKVCAAVSYEVLQNQKGK